MEGNSYMTVTNNMTSFRRWSYGLGTCL